MLQVCCTVQCGSSTGATHTHAFVSPCWLLQVQYKYVDDLATVYTEWAEMELRHKNYRSAVDLLARATAAPARTKRLTQVGRLPSMPFLCVSVQSAALAWHLLGHSMMPLAALLCSA